MPRFPFPESRRDTVRRPAPSAGDAVGYRFVDETTGGRLVVIPDTTGIDDRVAAQMRDADVLFFDGTFFDEDEMRRAGVGTALAAEMGHIPIGGPGGSLRQLAALPNVRRIYVHINNTNPILLENSPQRVAVEAAGIVVGYDGMEMELSMNPANSHQTPWPCRRIPPRSFTPSGASYHDVHPFHQRMNAGGLSPGQIRGWVANRFYYQRSIPIKDAAIISNCPIHEVRRVWLHRITDHDGSVDGPPGGIEAWLRLAEACGLSRDEVLAERHVVPGARFAVDAYVTLARTKPWPVAVASSLTELFAPDLMARRIVAFERHYQWVQPWGLEYFRTRVPRARKSDSDEAMELTLRYCDTRAFQEEAVAALHRKCDILRALLDAIMLAYHGMVGERIVLRDQPLWRTFLMMAEGGSPTMPSAERK